MSEYKVNKPIKYNGRQYKPGDDIELDGMWDDKLIAKGMVLKVDAEKNKTEEAARAKRAETRTGNKRVRRPKK